MIENTLELDHPPVNSSNIEIGSSSIEKYQIESFPDSLQYIIREIQKNRNNMSPDLAREIVETSNITPADLETWADYSHPDSDSYGRKLVYNEGFFEIMVMSWVPGDISAIHDHGYTLWGAVKVFGPAQHAAFSVSDGMIATTSREVFEPNRVIAVGHELVHQLGNMTDSRFLTLHMYGLYDPEFSLDSVTANARVFDISTGRIERTDGGMFFGLPEESITTMEPAPEPDFLSWSRNTVEYVRRMRRSKEHRFETLQNELVNRLNDRNNWEWLKSDIEKFLDANGHMTNLHYYNLLREELKEIASLQKEIQGEKFGGNDDSFHTYAELYDDVIGNPCLNDFMASYLRFAAEKYEIDYADSKILSIGCGTALVEKHILDTYKVPEENLVGIDNSAAMVSVAGKRINAKVMDILAMDKNPVWDITYQGLNVFQYLPKPYMEKAIHRTAAMTKQGGYFIGDFVTPDHMRWYPHIISSNDVISLRLPRFKEKDGNIYQESEIINVSRLNNDFRVTYEGRHLRYLPSMWKIRFLFQKFFKGQVDVYDAVTLEPVKTRADTTSSTRYILIARKE